MTTKKIVLIAGAVFAVLAVIAASFVGGFFGLYLYGVANSEAAENAKNFLRRNEKLKQDIGEVKDFGSIITGHGFPSENSSEATLSLKVIGDRKTVNASVSLIYTNRDGWRVSAASYVNSQGQKISLLDPYDSKIPVPLLVA